MLSIIIPACNEEDEIGQCLAAVLGSHGTHDAEVIVVANGCTDETAGVARTFETHFAGRGWRFKVLELSEGGKLNALNAGDAAAHWGARVYLDADVNISSNVLNQIADALNVAAPRYASGTLRIPIPRSWASKAYRRIYTKVPFITQGVPGAGLFAVNAEGRARWGHWGDIISDDTFARLSFTPTERIGVPATYDWPLVEGYKNLIKVRRRQEAGVHQLRENHPDLMKNDDESSLGIKGLLALGLRDPVGFAVYTSVRIAVRLTAQKHTSDWSRGR
ncbi:glycosyltransferase family 2 protein [Cochlodiniinecator piscidefendens]|uniref:glycosyltransferase family 2 protein n=1 Tax=Cochlodiniinecator piscidefendens TaxID=2715756 RepID=UPI0014074158|nr:glycosyltransferase [Cochlodiniinecator piscidefendens]